MSFQIPEPVQGYQLPSGKFVATQEEYIAEVTAEAAARLAGAYVDVNAAAFGRSQATRAKNAITEFLKWQAVQSYSGTLEETLAAYDAKLAAQAAAPVAEEAPAAE